ncbi:MAG: CBS domain-containing protein, partial [Deltaproteobacteria bacterium]|nr:CBS domain-containing protein [Deltaproteobacteria bacterium]
GRPIGMLSDRDVRGTVGDLRRAGQEVSESVAGYRVSDAMSAPVVSVTSKSSLNDAVRRFCDFEIGAVAVVGEDEGLVGICSYLDLLEGLAKG